jgi:hypothetical protein
LPHRCLIDDRDVAPANCSPTLTMNFLRRLRKLRAHCAVQSESSLLEFKYTCSPSFARAQCPHIVRFISSQTAVWQSPLTMPKRQCILRSRHRAIPKPTL